MSRLRSPAPRERQGPGRSSLARRTSKERGAARDRGARVRAAARGKGGGREVRDARQGQEKRMVGRSAFRLFRQNERPSMARLAADDFTLFGADGVTYGLFFRC